MEKHNTKVMRVDAAFSEYAFELQKRIVDRERRVISITEVTRRIANESVHPYEEAKKGIRKLGTWKL